jgi:putative redox protein
MKIKLNRINQSVHLQAVNEQGNVVDIDGAESIGGEGKGARPMQLMLMGLGGCSSMDVLSILQKQKVVLSNYNVNIDAERDPDSTPSLFTNIKIEFIFEGDDLGEVQVKKIKRAVELSMTKYCSVTKIIEKTANITYSSFVNGVWV